MVTRRSCARFGWPAFMVCLAALPAWAQQSSIQVQCPPAPKSPYATGVQCLHLSAGDGFATMGDGTPLYVFSFSKLPVDGDPGAPGIQPVDPNLMMAAGTLAANIPAPTITVKEGEELYLNLTNVGMIMRPDLSDPHSVHWHGFAQAAPVFDGVPDSSITIGMGASFPYFYLANDPGTYMYHCHVEATEHMQMGMLGNLYVEAKQNTLPAQSFPNGFSHTPWNETTQTGNRYAYNDGDGSTRYDVEVPIQITSLDPVFHEASITVQPLPFADMKDRYFLLNGRGYPDTVRTSTPCLPQTDHDAGSSNGETQCVNALVTATPGQRVLLRLSNLSVTEYVTIGTNGIPMQVVGRDARLLRGDDGSPQYYTTNSINLGGGESADVILDTTGLTAGSTYFLYAKNLNFLSNNAENFGGAMTEIRIQ